VKALLETYEIARELLAWYDKNRRNLPWRENTDPYRVWVSEIMLQQTRVEAARGYFIAFLERFPDVKALAGVDLEAVYKAWEGLGYYSRARRLWEAAQTVAKAGAFPQNYGEWIELPGVGAYTAAAIASICFGERALAVDGNVTRVVMRWRGMRDFATSPSAKRAVLEAGQVFLTDGRPGDGNQALMELGATVCIPGAPRCALCPLQASCVGFARGDAAGLPIVPPKKGKSVEQMRVVVAVREGRVLVRVRPDKGLLAGQWEFPHGLDEDAVRKLGLSELREIPSYRHVFTHKIWEMTGTVYRAESFALLEGTCRWVDAQELSALPIPSAMAPFRAAAMEEIA